MDCRSGRGDAGAETNIHEDAYLYGRFRAAMIGCKRGAGTQFPLQWDVHRSLLIVCRFYNLHTPPGEARRSLPQ